MLSFVTSAHGAFKTAMAAGAVTLTLAGATLGTAEPAQAHVRHVGGFHGGFGHHFGGFHHGGFGHRFDGYRVAHPRIGFHPRGYGARPYGYGYRRFAYGVGVPYGGYGFRRCVVGFRFIPGIGCRQVVSYGYPGVVRPLGYGPVRVVRPYGYGFHRYGYGVHRFDYGPGRRFGGLGFHRPGFGGHGFGVHHARFGGHPFGGHGGGHIMRRR